MSRSRTLKVQNGRIRHKCLTCGNNRMFPVPPRVKSRSVRCYKCGTKERVFLDHRTQPRTPQAGRVTLILSNGKEMATDLHDVSSTGVGATLAPADARSLHVKDEVVFKCSWNPRLLKGRYVIRSVYGTRIGVQNIRKKTF